MTAAERVHAGAAVLGGNGDAEQAQLAALFDQSSRFSVAGAVVLLGLGLDGLAREFAHRLAQKTVLVVGLQSNRFERERRGHREGA